MMRFQSSNRLLFLCTTAVGVLILLALGLWIGLSNNTTVSQINSVQNSLDAQISVLQQQMMEILANGDNTTRVLRQNGTFQWSGYVGSTLCQPTEANFSVYDIVVSNVLTFTQLMLYPPDTALALTGSNCPNDGSILDIIMTDFQPSNPLEVLYLSSPYSSVPMSTQAASIFLAQCNCLIITDFTINVPFPGYRGYGLIDGLPSFGFQYQSLVGTILPLNFLPSQPVSILMLTS